MFEDVFLSVFEDEDVDEYDKNIGLCLVIIGCLNVGKFMLVNCLLGEECVVVFD